jgi:hypothetical protein
MRTQSMHGPGTVSQERCLRCPNCNSFYLHHYEMWIYERREDAEQETVTIVGGGDLVRGIVCGPSGNPSGRRGGISIRFWCEECGRSDLELTLAQHKGETLIAWRDIDRLDNRHKEDASDEFEIVPGGAA